MEKLSTTTLSRILRRKLPYTLILLLNILGVCLRMYILEGLTPVQHVVFFLLETGSMWLVWALIAFLDRYLNRMYPYERSLVGRIVIQTLAAWVFLILLQAVLLKVPIVQQMCEVVNCGLDSAMNQVQVLSINLLIVTMLNVGFSLNHFVRRWREEINRTEVLQREAAQVQYQNLKNQVNPHFLFNSLTSLHSLIFDNQQLASQFLQQLSRVYRYVLQNTQDRVSLQVELDFIHSYVSLLQIRYQEGIRFSYDIGEHELDSGIVPVTLQILIENAIKHNVVSVDKPLHIRVFTLPEGYVVVENNLQKRSVVEGSNKTGLANLKALYSYLSDKPVRVEESWHTFQVQIPLL